MITVEFFSTVFSSPAPGHRHRFGEDPVWFVLAFVLLALLAVLFAPRGLHFLCSVRMRMSDRCT